VSIVSTVPGTVYDSPYRHLIERAAEIACSYEGVREQGGANRGPEVEAFLAAVGLPPGNAWCAAFAVFCLKRAAKELGMASPASSTGKVARLWRRAPEWARAVTPPPYPSIFVHLANPEDPESKGHTGFVLGVTGTHAITIEGNTSQAGSREGDGVYRQKRPTVGSTYITGYLDFAADPDPTVRLRVG